MTTRNLFQRMLTPALMVLMALQPDPDGPGMARAATLTPAAGPCSAFNGPVCVGADGACDYSDLQAAIDAASTGGGTTTILVAKNQNYSGQHLSIHNRNVTLVGGYASCADYLPSGTTTLHGSSLFSVIDISADAPGGRIVELRNLTIRDGGGSDPTGFDVWTGGGGVMILGNVDVTIASSIVEENYATMGGGVFLDGADGATLAINNGSAIRFNDAISSDPAMAGSGGGVACTHGGHVTLDGSGVYANQAQRPSSSSPPARGGGVFLDACSFEGSASSTTGQGIYSNVSDDDGGGIYLVGDGNLVLACAADSAFPLEYNSAGHHGGGIYAGPGDVVLGGVAVEHNSSGVGRPNGGVGGGIYAINSDISMETSECPGSSSLSFNQALGPGFGNAIYANDNYADGTGIRLTLWDTRISHNDNASVAAIQLSGGPSQYASLSVRNILAINNQASSVFKLTGYATAVITSSTFADNDVNAVLANTYQNGIFELDNSIVNEAPQVATFSDPDHVDLQIFCLLAGTNNGFPVGEYVYYAFVEPDAGFIGGGDYHLKATSPAIDHCSNVANDIPETDLDWNLRGVNAPQAYHHYGGSYDVGAYEWTSPELIFFNGFER